MPDSPESAARELSRAEGRRMLDERTRRVLGMSLAEFEAAYDARTLDLGRSGVIGLVMLLPFARDVPPPGAASADEPDPELVDLPCGCQDVHYADGRIDREHDHVECDGRARSTGEVLAHADELARRFEDDNLDPGRGVDGASLRAVRVAGQDLAKAVCAAHAEGHSWAAIGAMLGVTGATARRRYGGTTRFDDES